ncbi:MAG TPA: RIP metalloprotease RseP [Candidatus Polarisedimenticolia bacterium]|nr:RIP metalloprotease RseP [Candidatus Polarisedimenticolia bacterium]
MPDPITMLAFIFILGALIFIHESGHYFVAKALGIKVEVFSLGFGPKLLSYTRGGTEYCISALPVGGYVKMLGENPDEALRGSREEFQSRSKFERFLVLVMGASLNIVLAVVLMAGLYMHGVPEPLYMSQPPVIGAIDPNGSGAAAGLRVDDAIVAVDGEEVASWRDLLLTIALNPDREVILTVRRGGETSSVPVRVQATRRDRIGDVENLGISPAFPLTAGQVEQGGAADRAGVRKGDVLVALDGIDLSGLGAPQRFVSRISENPGRPMTLTVSREGRSIDLAIVPAQKQEGGQTRGYVGIALGAAPSMGIRQYAPLEAVVESLKHNWEQSGVLFLTLKKLVAGQLSPRTLSGPIEIYRMTGESLRRGPVDYVLFMSLVSLQLGIINLLPIPVLDGGHIFILLVEGIMRREFSMRIKERVMQFGFILLLLIMGGVISMDLYKNLFLGPDN